MTILRTALIVVAVLTACVLFQEVRLWMQCSEPVELRASDVAGDARWRSGAPMAARLREAATPQPPFAITSDAGNPNGAGLVFTSPEDSRTVLAVLLCSTVGEARAFYRNHGTVDIEALASVPRPKTKDFLEGHLRRAGLLFRGSFRVLETDRGPIGLAGMAFLTLLVILCLVPYLASTFHLRFRFLDAVRRRLTAFFTATFEWPAPHGVETTEADSAPLPEEVKVHVHRMLEDAWEHAGPRE